MISLLCVQYGGGEGGADDTTIVCPVWGGRGVLMIPLLCVQYGGGGGRGADDITIVCPVCIGGLHCV